MLKLQSREDFSEEVLRSKSLDLPSIPECELHGTTNLVFLWMHGLTLHHGRDCHIEEGVAHFVNFDSLDNLHHLNGLKCSDCGSGSSKCWYDPSSLDLNSNPVHRWQTVVSRSNISQRINKVNMEVSVIILFKLFHSQLLLAHLTLGILEVCLNLVDIETYLLLRFILRFYVVIFSDLLLD